MAKDLTTKRCLSDNERYADLINGAVFRGRQLLKAQDLTDRDSHAVLRRRKTAGKKKGDKPLYRDLIKKAAFGVNFAVISLEDQDKVHYLMPLRNMAYEAAEYDRQAEVIRKQVQKLPDITEEEFLSGFLKDSRLWPCVTFVLYFGEHWDGSRDLHGILDMKDIPEELQSYVNNYPIHVIEVRKLQDTDVFRTDLKQIFDFIRFSKERDKLLALVQSDPAYQELDEAAYDMVSEYVNEEGLIEMKKYQGKGGKVNMCKALEDMRAESREEGREEGLAWGIGAFIEAYQEFQVSKEKTIVKLCEKFDLSRERAEDCVRKYWK